jgi:hypothetical protein
MKFSTSTFIALLSFSARNNLAMADDRQYVYYGNTTYLQNYDTQNAWLNTGGGIADLTIADITTQAYLYETGQFILVSQGALGNPSADPKLGTCVKFGDQFGMFQQLEQSWVAVSDGTACHAAPCDQDCCVPSGIVFSTGYGFPASNDEMIFTIRSTQGNGLLSQETNIDPLFGQCVQQNSVAFVQSTLQNSLWLGKTKTYTDLTTAQVGYIGASTTSTILSQQIQYPHWIISTTLSDGSTSNALACQAIPSATQGNWVAINGVYNGIKQTVTYTYGTTTTDTQSVTNTTAWKNSITGTATAGFQFMGASASVKVSATGEFSGSQETSVNTAVMQSTSKSVQVEFDQGQVWQFVYDTADVCDVNGFSILVEELVLTNGQYDYPCCLPGYFVDNNNPHGPCVAINGTASPCVCGDEICNGTPPSRGLRGSMN